MQPIKIIRGRTVLAEHTTNHPASHYGQPVWVVHVASPRRGVAQWQQAENKLNLQIIGVVDSWLVCKQPGGGLCGIIWSDGSYFAEMIIRRDTGQVVSRATRKQLASGKYMIRSTICAGDFGGALGSVL